MITQKIKLNLIPGGILPRIKASQYDTGARTLVFKLYNGAQEFTIPTDSTVSIRGTKSDRTGFQYECEYSGSEVTAKITDQMTVSPGEVLAELVITNDGNRIATGNFIFENEEAALKEDVPISHTDIPWIEHIDDLVDLVEEDAQRAETAADRAEDSLGQIGDSVEQAASSASAAATSATNSANSAAQATSSATSASNSATAASTSEANALASEQAAKTSEDNANASATQAATSASNAADSASDSADSATNALASKQAAKTSEDNASASKNAAAQSALDASGSASAANASATQAATSATNAATSEGNAAISAANAATSETNASQSATDAAGSASDASDSASDADTSATNAENSATLARKWAVGDSGSGTATPSDTNNAYYWAQVAQRAAGGGLTIEVVAALPTTDISVSKIYLVPSSDPESQNVKDEYINLDGTTSGWELIGSTKVDLSGYYTKAQIDAIVQDVKDYADGKVAELKTYVQENYTPTTLLKDTVGWTGKNLIPYPYIEKTHTQSGITWTDNGDGTITANGTATAYSELTIANRVTSPLHFPTGKYILSGCPSGGSASTYRIIIGKTVDSAWSQLGVDSGNGCIVDIDKNDDIGLNIGAFTGTTMENLTFYPMLRRADIADDTWEPYHKPVEEVVEELQEFDSNYVNVYGAKNLISYPYYETSKTAFGITTTDNGDGTLTFNGVATSSSVVFRLVNNDDNVKILLEKYNYILSWVEADKYRKSFRIDIGLVKTDGTKQTKNGNAGDAIRINNKDGGYKGIYAISVYSENNQTVSDLTFKPMLRLASIKDDTWAPYAKTNKQLTEDVKRLEAYEFETLEAAQAAVQAGKVPDGAIIYIPSSSEI